MNSYALTGIGFGAFIFIGIAGFYSINHLGLASSTATATVVDKHYTPSGTSYRTTVVNNQSIVQPQKTDEIFAVVYEIDGEKILGVHNKTLYDRLEINDEVIVTITTTRITQQTLVIDVK